VDRLVLIFFQKSCRLFLAVNGNVDAPFALRTPQMTGSSSGIGSSMTKAIEEEPGDFVVGINVSLAHGLVKPSKGERCLHLVA
jgi:hypothetical protein